MLRKIYKMVDKKFSPSQCDKIFSPSLVRHSFRMESPRLRRLVSVRKLALEITDYLYRGLSFRNPSPCPGLPDPHFDFTRYAVSSACV